MYKENFIQFVTHLSTNSVNYKYCKAEYAVRALEKETLLFSHASIFNDPFDCNVNLFDFDEEYVSNYNKELIEKHKGSNYLERFRLNRNFQSKILPKHKEYMQQILEVENSNRGVTCFSKNCNNLLMWAHYANNHTGICIGYDLLMLRDFVHKENPESFFLPINYVEKIIPRKDFRAEDSILHWFGTKNSVWNYEEEIRYIVRPLNFNKKRCAYKIPKEIIKEVLLGISISDENKETILNLIRKKYPHIRLLQAVADYNTFQIKVEEIFF